MISNELNELKNLLNFSTFSTHKNNKWVFFSKLWKLLVELLVSSEMIKEFLFLTSATTLAQFSATRNHYVITATVQFALFTLNSIELISELSFANEAIPTQVTKFLIQLFSTLGQIFELLLKFFIVPNLNGSLAQLSKVFLKLQKGRVRVQGVTKFVSLE